MSSIDERVVKMRLDNSQFEQGISKSSSLLGKLKKALNLDKSVESINNVDKAVSGISFNPLTSGLQSVQSGFNAMGAVAFSVLNRMTNAAIDAGMRITNELTASVRDGFAEYETQMGSVQTILSNTMSKGTNLNQVNNALDTLNTYADKTIYNFTEMTRNIGTFTAAGVDLQTSVDSIKGIANLAAASGSSSAQAASAMYQLSQALAAGKIQLMDWNSVVNAGMGGEVFQNALKRTAEHFGTNVDGMIKKYGSFRESLTKGEWLTADVMTETLKQISGAYSEADLVEQGYTEQQAKDIVNLANTANDAATKVKTFTQLIDTTKEALGSGWTQSWEIMIGDFEEAKDLWTGISDSLGNIISDSADARNELLGNLSTGYKQFVTDGIDDTTKFNEALTEVAKNHGVNIEKLINDTGSFEKACKQGWVTGDMLKESVNKMADSYNKMSAEERKNNNITSSTIEKTNRFAQALNDGSISADEFANKFNRKSGRENIIEGLSSAFSSLWKVMQSVKGAWDDFFPSMAGETLYQYTVKFRNLMEAIKPSSEQLDLIKRSFKGLFAILDIGKQAIFAVIGAIGKIAGNGAMGGFINGILKGTASMGDYLVKIDQTIKSSGIFVKVANRIATGIQNIIKFVKSVINYFDNLGRSIKSSTNAFDVIGNKLESLKNKLKSILSSSGNFKEKFSSIFNSVGDVITKVATTITHGLGEAIKWATNNISFGDVIAGLLGGGAFVMIQKLSKAIDQVKDIFEKISNIFGKPKEAASDATGLKDILGGVKDALSGFTQGLKVASIVAVAVAIGILAHALKTISEIDVLSLGTSITAMGGLMAMLNKSFKSLVKSTNTLTKGNSLIKSAAALLIYAKAIQMLAKVLVMLKDLSIEQLAKGLGSIGVMMFALNKSIKGLDKKVSLKTAVSLIVMAKAIQMLVKPIQQLSTLSWEQIAKGLTAVGGALGEMAGAMKLLSFSKVSLKNSVAMIAMAKAMQMMAQPLMQLSKLSWEEIGRGLTAMGGALGEMGIVLAALGKIGGFSSIFAAGSILMVVSGLDDIADALKKFGSMSWEEIGRGLDAMGGALAEMAIVLAALGKIAGFSSIFAAGAIRIVTNGLYDISTALLKMGGMSWEEVGRGLTAMGGALGEIGLVTGALGKIAGISGLIGAGSIRLVCDGLWDIATSLEKLGKMSWEEVGRGLDAMGGALGEITIVTGALGKFAGISGLIGGGAILITVQSLGDIADALKKFGAMSWEEIGRGLDAMGGALGEITIVTGALGKFGGLSSLIGGGAILLTVQSLGDIADALQKMGGMSWDEIGRGLVAMGGALGEISLITGALGSLAGLPALLGGGAILLSVQSLGDIADALKKFGAMSWDEIGRGITAMGGALGAAGLGSLMNSLSGFGAGAIATYAKPLGDLADSVNKWNGVSVPPNLESDLSALARGAGSFTLSGWGAGNLPAVATGMLHLAPAIAAWNGVSVPPNIGTDLQNLADGVGSFTLSGWGAENLPAVASGLADLVPSINAWNGVSVPPNIESDLSSLADGVGSFTLSGWGAGAIGTVAKPLGDLADSVNKWNGVSTPPNISTDLSDLASGVGEFTLSGWGAENLPAVASGLADLVPSINAWNGVSVPPNISTDLSDLASGVKKFTLSGWGAENLPAVATGMSKLAPAINKWNGISTPPNISTDLSDLASGVKKFTLSGWGAGNLPAVATGMSKLASAINKWNGVSVPPNIKSDLQNLSDGIKSFNLANAGGQSLGQVTGPLGNLAGSVNKWNGVSVPPNIGTDLSAIANGVKSFAGVSADSSSILTSISNGLSSLAGSVNKWNGVSVPPNIGTDLSAMANGIKSFAGASADSSSILTSISNGLSSLASSIIRLSNSGIRTIGSSIQSMVNSINSTSGITTNLPQQMSTFASQLGSAISEASTAVSNGMNGIVDNINAMADQFSSAGTQLSISLVQSIASGLKLNQIQAMNAMSSLCEAMIYQAKQTFDGSMNKFKEFGVKMVDNVVSGMNSKKSAVHDSGADTIQGFINGMNSKQSLATETAEKIATATLDAANKASGVASPSWKYAKMAKFCVEGIANGFLDNRAMAVNAVTGVVNSMNSAYDDKLSAMNRDGGAFSFTPTVSPVVDLNAMNAADVRGSLKLNPNSVLDTSSTMFEVEKQRSIRLDTSRQMRVDNSDVVKAVNGVTKQVDILGQQVTNMKMVMDSGVMVGALASKMDKKLGRSAAYKERGI